MRWVGHFASGGFTFSSCGGVGLAKLKISLELRHWWPCEPGRSHVLTEMS